MEVERLHWRISIVSEYAGQWVSIADRKVVAAGKQLDVVISDAGKNRPFEFSRIFCLRETACLLKFCLHHFLLSLLVCNFLH